MSFGNLSNSFQAYDNDFGLGHNGARLSLNYFDGIPEQNLLNSLGNNTLRLIFKSLLKRDDTTKEKALSDLNTLIDEDISTNQGKESQFNDDIFLICWSQIYAKLVTNEVKSIRNYGNSFTIKLITLLGKSVSKFLKDYIPFILLGTCDTDVAVSKNCSEEFKLCFNNDSGKLQALWKVFEEQILSLAKEILINETIDTISDQRYVAKEEAAFKYNRLSTSAVNLLLATVSMNTETYVKGEHADIYKDILSSDSFWKSFNLNDNFNLKQYQSILRLVVTLYTTKFFKYNKDIFKTAVRYLLKSMTQINKKNILNVNTVVPLIMDSLITLTDYKDGRIWSYDKHSKEKLLSFLSVTSRNAVPQFFNQLYQLYMATTSIDLLNYESEWLPLWVGSLDEINKKSFLGKYGATVLTELWTNFDKFLKENDDIRDKYLEDYIPKTLRSCNDLNKLPDLKKFFQEVCNPLKAETELENAITVSGNDVNKAEKYYQGNLLSLVISSESNDTALESLCSFILHILSDEPTESVKSVLFAIVIRLLSTDTSALDSGISTFIFELPTWVEKTNFKLASDIVVKYTKSKYIERNSEWITSLQDFFTVCTTLDIDGVEIINVLGALDLSRCENLLNSDPAIVELIESYITGYSFEEQGTTRSLFKSHLLNEKLVEELYVNSKSKAKVDEFVSCAGYLSPSLQSHLILNTPFLLDSMFVISDDITISTYDIVSKLLSSGEVNKEKLVERTSSIITNFVRSCDDITLILNDPDSICLKITDDFIQKFPECVSKFIPTFIEEYFVQFVPEIDYRTCVGQNLSLTPFMVLQDDQLQDIQKWLELINVGMFLDRLVSKSSDLLSNDLVVLLSIISELVSDYNTISPSPNMDFTGISHTLLKMRESNPISLSQVVDCFDDDSDSSDSVLARLLKSFDVTTDFYKIRVLQRVIQNDVESASTSAITSLIPQIEKYVSGTVRSKEFSRIRYLVSSAILTAFSSFSNQEALSKLRTLLAAECIGIRESELLQSSNRTLHTLILLSNILEVNGSSVDISTYIPIAPQRFSMILKTVDKWLDSDIIYEPAFIGVRLALLKVFSSVLRFPAFVDMTTSIFGTTGKLLVDSLTMCQLDDTPYILALRMADIQLCQGLKKCNAPESFDDEFGTDISDSIIELPFIVFPGENDNQVSALFYKALNTAFDSLIPTKILLPQYERFLQTFLEFEKSRMISARRLIVLILGRIVKERQQTQVIEFELRQQHLHTHEDKEDDDDDQFFDAREDMDAFTENQNLEEEDFKIPHKLIEKLVDKLPVEYLEYCNTTSFIEYLWDWHITLQFFDNVSYKMRQLYINQLKENDLIDKLFEFVSDQIDMGDIRFYKEQLTAYDIGHYESIETEFLTYSAEVSDECKYLMMHIMFELFKSVGSLTNMWFMNIKDRSLKNKIDSFVSQFISPILIKNEIDSVSRKIEDFEKKDEALSIKVNNVTHEIRASYLIDEQNLVISFKLPNNYPLNNVEVIGVSRVGITEQKWKQWIMSTQHVITGMNGSVLDSLELFTKNVHLQFSGFEECAICYSILHAVDRKLPTKVCPTCSNRFHGACLYKWFRSSGNNTCPLCRGEIPFRK